MKKGFPMKTRLDQRADKISADGHCYITIDSVDYLAEELAFFYTTGQWPKYGVEHVNGTTFWITGGRICAKRQCHSPFQPAVT